jgi:hypothetical protein
VSNSTPVTSDAVQKMPLGSKAEDPNESSLFDGKPMLGTERTSYENIRASEYGSDLYVDQ